MNPPNSAHVAARADFVNNNGVLIPGETINVGTTVNAISGKTGIEFPVTLTATVLPGDTLFLPDPYDAKLFMSTSCGVWYTNPLDKVNGQVWYKITNQDADVYGCFRRSKWLHCTACVGLRISQCPILMGATFPAGGSQNPSAVLYSITTSSSVQVVGSMEGVAVDPNDPNHVLVAKTPMQLIHMCIVHQMHYQRIQHSLAYKMMIRKCHTCHSMMLRLITMMLIVI